MIRILTDSTSDLDRAHCAEIGVDILPLHVFFGDEEYIDGETMTHREFYDRLREAEAPPTTAQINPDRFLTLFKEAIAAGDEVICILISSALSGTYQSAVIAKGMMGEAPIHIIDSRNVTFGLGLLVEIAAHLRSLGHTAESIVAEITSLVPKVRLFAVVDTLKYLKMGGRISAATAFVGGLMGILPIVSIEDGKVESIGKARGKAAAYTFIRDKIQAFPMDTQYPIAFGHSDSTAALEEIMSFFSDLSQQQEVLIGDIGCTVGTHAGPNACGIAYIIQ